MKKFALVTISLCAALTAAFGGTAAFADESFSTHYPEAFEPCTLTDYAVNGSQYAFTDGKKIAVYEDGSDKPQYHDYKTGITALDCTDGNFCFKDESGSVRLLDENGSPSDHEIQSAELSVITGSGANRYFYVILEDKSIRTTDSGGKDSIIEGEFSNLKVFDDVAYAVSGNFVNRITPPAECQKIPYEIADYSSADFIRVGDTVKNLNSYNSQKLHFCELKEGEPLTEIYLDTERFPKSMVKPSDYFKTGETFTIGNKKDFNAGMTAFVLCKTGNADIITANGKYFIKLGGSVTERELSAPEFQNAIINVPEDFVYSSPAMLDGTKLFKVQWGNKIKVLGKVEKDISLQITADFYKIALLDQDGNVAKEENGAEKTGYVPCSFVFEKADENERNETPDPDYKEDTVIKTVVLVLIVVALVLIAAGYITFVLTKDKKKKN